VLDKVNLVQLRIADQRSDLADLGHSLEDMESRVARLEQAFHGGLSDHLAQFRSQLEVDRYLESTMERLIQYGRAMRLVVCYVESASTDDPRRPSTASSHSGLLTA